MNALAQQATDPRGDNHHQEREQHVRQYVRLGCRPLATLAALAGAGATSSEPSERTQKKTPIAPLTKIG
jgi:hypothetical protein